MDRIFRLIAPALLLSALTILSGCGNGDEPETPPPPAAKTPPVAKTPPPPAPKPSFSEARAGFKTKLIRKETEDYPSPEPTAELFDLIQYPAPLGKTDAYVSVDPDDGKKHPAIIWIVGGFGNSISEVPWEPATADNDQSASVFWKSGIITMYPSLRGGNESPGFKEGLFGEVDDIISAAEHLATIPYVDPTRIYLGGHSVGGTLVLLVAESTDKFRAVFALGAVESTSYYGQENVPYNVRDAEETKLRAPIFWLHSIKTPTFIFEGTDGNIDSLRALARANKNPLVQTFPVKGGDHFGIIRPLSKLAVKKILEDKSPDSKGIKITPAEIAEAIN